MCFIRRYQTKYMCSYRLFSNSNSWFVLLRELVPTHRTRIIIKEPRFQTIWMEDVATGYKHTIMTHLYLLHTDGTGWWLQPLYRYILWFLTMLLLNLNYRQISYCLGTGLFLDFLGIVAQLAPLLAYEGSSPPFVGKLFLFFVKLGLELPRLLFELLFTEDFGVIMVFLDIGQLFLNHGHLLFDFRFR